MKKTDPRRVHKGIAFGVFDGLHEGHKHFLTDAASRCEKLIVVVGRDSHTRRRKGKAPKMNENERMKQVRAFLPNARVVLADEEEGSWHTLKEHSPDLAFLGYDQQALSEGLQEVGMLFVFLEAHKPDTYKSSIRDGNPHRG
mgnify:CR=1 FL=1